MGGSDDQDNIARLTPEEHYLAHQILTKLHPSHGGLARAAHMMCSGRPTNKYYGWVRRRFAEVQSQSITGESNPAYNTKMVFNPSIRQTKRVHKDEPLSPGWQEGAVYDYDSYFKRMGERESKKEFSRKLREVNLERKLKELKELHEIYVKEGFAGVVNTGYDKSKQNLVMQFAKHLSEFVPQNGKKRGL